MKRHLKRALSLMLSVALIMTGIVITPANVVAADDTAFISNQIVLEDEGNVDLSKVLYWKGQTFELSVDVKAAYQNSVTWTTSNSDAENGITVLEGTNGTVVDSGVGYTITNQFQIGTSASGSYTITATVAKADGTTESKAFTLSVEEELVGEISSVGYAVSGTRWTSDEINLYIVTAADVECYGFETDNELVQIVQNDLLETPYYGKGSNVYKVNAIFGDTIAEGKNQMDNVTITAKTSAGNKAIYYDIYQSASQIRKDSIKVSCTQCAEHTECTHINEAQNTIYLDMGQSAVISCVVEGSTKDVIDAYIPVGATNYTIDDQTYAYDEEAKTTTAYFYVTAKSVTAKNTPTKITLASISGHMVSKELNIIIYKGGMKDGFSFFGGVNEHKSGSSIVIDEGATCTYETSVVKNDTKESITWTSSEPAIVEINETTGTFVGKSAGTAVITATVNETNSGRRGQTAFLYITVQGIVPPDKMVIMQEDGVTPAIDTKLYVGDAATVFTNYATKNGDTASVYYKDYEWISEGKDTYFKIATTAGINGPEEKVSITPIAKGTAALRVKTATGVYSEPINLQVIAPATSIAIQKEGTTTTTLKAIENRTYELAAVRNKEASTEVEKILWSSSNSAVVNFIDPETNEECNTYTGDTCIVNVKEIGSTQAVQLTAKTVGLDTRSKAVATCDVTLEKSISANSVIFSDATGKNLVNSQDEPYIINLSTSSVSIGIKGYDSNGNVANDEFIGTIDVTSVVSASWNEDKQSISIKPLRTGNATIHFKNLQTNEVYVFYIKVQIPATSITFNQANTAYQRLTLNKGAEYNLGQDLVLYPSNATDGIEWSSSNPSIVSVNENGKIVANAYTQEPVIITATSTLDERVKGECEIYVVNPITDIELTATNQDGEEMVLDGYTVLPLNESMTVVGKVIPEDATDTYGWSTSNSSIAAIEVQEDGSCKIIGKAQGTVTISATPKVEVGADVAVKSFKLTVAKEATEFEVRSGSVNGALVTEKGVDMQVSAILYAVLTPSESHDVVQWKAEPSDAVKLTVTNVGTTHSCKIDKVIEGQTIKLTVMTSSGIAKEFEVRTGKPVSDCVVETITDKIYTGNQQRPVLVVRDGDYTLKENTDYRVVYPNDCISSGKKEITVQGIGVYCGVKTVTYTIVPADISNATFTNINNQTYTGKEIKPNVITYVGNKGLTVNRDYEVSYTNNINAGTATVTVKGIGNYTGTATTTFKIIGKTNFTCIMESSKGEYTGSAITPTVTVKDSNVVLVNGKDYTLSYENNVEIGTAKVIVKGIGNYSGEKIINYTITAKVLTLDMVKLNKTDFVYNGKACKPKVTIKHPETGKNLKNNTDYIVTYPTDIVNKGVKKITITGKGNYSGTLYVEYGVAEKVTLKKPSIKKVKNSKKKTVAFEVKNVANAEGYEVYYSTSKKFTEDTTEKIDITKNKTNIKKLKKGKTYYFKVRAYKKNSIGRTIYSSMSKVKKVKIKK